MADVKLSALPVASTVAPTDRVVVVTDPGGTPVAKTATPDDLAEGMTKIGKVTVTQPATGSTITVADGKTLTASNNADVSGTNTGDQAIAITGDVTGTWSGGSIPATIADGAVTEAKQTLADNTTNDVSTTKHGYVPKAPNDLYKFLRGDGSWAYLPDISARAYQGSATSITTSWVALPFTSEDWDTASIHDNSSNTTRFTIPVSGKYAIYGQMKISANAVTGLRVRLNGTTVKSAFTRGNGGSPEYVQVYTELNLTAGDYIEFMGYSGSTQNSSGDAETYGGVRKVS